MHFIDAALLIAFVIYAAWTGFSARKRASTGLEEYFLAGRALSGTKAGLSMAATQFAADTPLLVTGLVATSGIFALWRLWIYAIAFLMMGFLLAPAWRKASVLTDAELTELRYGSRVAGGLRAVKAVYFGLIFNCTVLAMVLWAAKEIAEPFLPWHEWISPTIFAPLRDAVHAAGVPFARQIAGGDVWVRSTDNLLSIGAIVALTTLYSATGGLRSVVDTDVVQLIIMMTGTLVYAVYVVHQVGGLSALANGIRKLGPLGPRHLDADQILAFTPDRAGALGFPLLAVILLQWLVQINADGTGYLAQRVMACRSDKDARFAALLFTGVQVLFRSLLWLPIALGLLLLYPVDPANTGREVFRAAREVTFVTGIKDLLPPGARGLMLTGMLAALASTVDTHLNWGASYFANDLYQRFLCRSWLRRQPSGRELVWVARIANLAILIIAVFVMGHLSSIQTAWHTSLLFGAGLGPLLVLRWVWWRISAAGEIGAIVASTALAPLLLWLLPDREALRLLLMASGATFMGVAVSLIGPPEPAERLREFYRRTRAPGFWGPQASALGESPEVGRRRLLRGTAATATSVVSVFSLLTGIGTWLVQGPPPRYLPSRTAFVALMLVVSLSSALTCLGLIRSKKQVD